MKKELDNYILEAEEILKGKVSKKEVDAHLLKIQYFSHERFVHLIITMFWLMFSLTFIVLSFIEWYFIFITLILILVLLFYIFRYFYIESSVRYLYKLYEKMNKKLK